jgi:hypothetical protein
MLLCHGINPVVSAAALLDFSIATKSNFAYLTISTREVDEAVKTLHSLLGWD